MKALVMITAQEAREQLKSLEGKHAEEAKRKVDTAVKDAVQKGSYSTYVYGSYSLLVKAEVIAKHAGYSTTLTDAQRDGPMLKLSWLAN